MMEDNKKRVFTMPLLELVLVIGIFVVVSVILMKMFLSADQLRGSAVVLSEQTILAENDIEQLKDKTRSMGFDAAVAEMGYEKNGDSYVRTEHREDTEKDSEYKLELSTSQETIATGIIMDVTVTVSCAGTSESLSTSIYVANDAAN